MSTRRAREAAHGAIAAEYQRPSTSDQVAFNYTSEELTMILRPMVETKAEAIGSMGDDTPLAMFSNKPRSLFGYFRQRFAEVTNPPIDPLREELVMSLKMRLGARGNFLIETAEQARLLELDRPFLTDGELATLKADPELKTVTLSTLVPSGGAEPGLGGPRASLAPYDLESTAPVPVRA
jgi:glutamate synthase (ferredoxin)